MLKSDSCGIEVSAKTLWVCLRRQERMVPAREFSNTAAGHRQLAAWVSRPGRAVRVCMEATGTYGLDLALLLSDCPNLELVVVNPKTARRFAEALQRRNKSDLLDVAVLEEFARRMPAQPWKAPSPQALKLRALARRLAARADQLTAERNRLHAALSTQTSPKALIEDLQGSIQQLRHARQELLDAAVEILHSDPQLERRYRLMLSVQGIGSLSAVLILAELCVLAQDYTAPQWVAFAGLDPRRCQSGTSVDRKPHLSKAGNRYLRRALYMPALVAVTRNDAFKDFYQRLLARGKKPLQALVAAMRKLLHALFGMFRNDQTFDPQRLFATQPDTPQKLPKPHSQAIFCP